MHTIRLFALILLVTAILPLSAQAAVVTCGYKVEKDALDFRVMHSDLMVAALTCGQKDYYNRFIGNNPAFITKQTEMMRSYFNRVYGQEQESRFNQFITRIANGASRKSLKMPLTLYCLEASRTFSKLLKAQDNASIVKVVNDKKFDSGVKSCSRLAVNANE